MCESISKLVFIVFY